MSFYKVTDISSGYPGKKVIHNVSFEIERGEIVGLLGLNGSGKSTLLKTCCNLLSHEGNCEIESEQAETLTSKKLARLCAYLPQKSGISIDMGVLDVVLMGFNPKLGLLQYPTAEMRKRALLELTKVGLSDCEKKNYMELSEGQKRLCILARTFVSDSKILFLDEPDNSLDLRIRYDIFDRIKQFAKEKSCGVLASLHDINLALEYCDRLLLMDEGRLLQNLDLHSVNAETLENALTVLYGKNKIIEYPVKDKGVKFVLVKESV